jgi:transcriptional regulator with XRE-family HTH domain
VQKTRHWTAESNEAFLHKISFDFVAQLEKKIEELPITQGMLARKLGVSEGAVSHILNNPQNLTLKTIIAYARVLGLKVSIVAYDDGDPNNERGPIDSAVFTACWENVGRPSDFWSLNNRMQLVTTEVFVNPVQLFDQSYTISRLPWDARLFHTTVAGVDLGFLGTVCGITKVIYSESSTAEGK